MEVQNRTAKSGAVTYELLPGDVVRMKERLAEFGEFKLEVQQGWRVKGTGGRIWIT